MKAVARLAIVLAALSAPWVLMPAASVQAGTMYKWVDEKGVTHFSEDAPPDGKAQKIDVKPLPPSSNAPAPNSQDWRVRELELRQKRLDKERAEKKSQQDAGQREARCLRAQRDLDLLQRQRPIYNVDKEGKRVYIDDQQRAADIDAARKAAEAYCG